MSRDHYKKATAPLQESRYKAEIEKVIIGLQSNEYKLKFANFLVF